MEKGHQSKPGQKRAVVLKLSRETLRQLETSQLQAVAGGVVSVGTPTCNAYPCVTR